ncbi:MAG: hypothetical protein LBN95_02040 [Prevotellaceae bacterium]|nr:hypothetical protein [Prevotellaceae bacterium]
MKKKIFEVIEEGCMTLDDMKHIKGGSDCNYPCTEKTGYTRCQPIISDCTSGKTVYLTCYPVHAVTCARYLCGSWEVRYCVPANTYTPAPTEFAYKIV